MSEPIVNKVAESSLVTLDLEAYYPQEPVVTFDLKPFLFMELILKEKDFRQQLLAHDWEQYKGTIVGVTCTADAIIPVWAYMLVISYLRPQTHYVYFGTAEEALKARFIQNIRQIDPTSFTDQRVVVKGCGELPIAADAYLEIAKLLQPVVKSLMYGEPCSTVPLYKKK
jgi:hypothetical protein